MMLTCGQKFGRQYESVVEWRAHGARILASAFTTYRGRPMFVTGGNDDTIAVWDIRDCVQTPSGGKRTSNGMATSSYMSEHS